MRMSATLLGRHYTSRNPQSLDSRYFFRPPANTFVSGFSGRGRPKKQGKREKNGSPDEPQAEGGP
jgi:hypothetical protein